MVASVNHTVYSDIDILRIGGRRCETSYRDFEGFDQAENLQSTDGRPSRNQNSVDSGIDRGNFDVSKRGSARALTQKVLGP